MIGNTLLYFIDNYRVSPGFVVWWGASLFVCLRMVMR